MKTQDVIINFILENELQESSTKQILEQFTNVYPEEGVSYQNIYNAVKKMKEGYVPSLKISVEVGEVVEEVELKVDDISEMIIDPKLLIPLKTGHEILDKIMSKRGGLMPGTRTMFHGDPGVGKTTVITEALRGIIDNNEGAEVGFVQSEMDRVDFIETVGDGKQEVFKGMKMLFCDDYVTNDQVTSAFIKFLEIGYSVVAIDSLEDLQSKIQAERKWSRSEAETFLINLLKRISEEKGTAFVIIQQETKGGMFVGSNKLKHMFQATCEFKFENGKRYMAYTKNRRGDVNRQAFYDKDPKTGKIVFDQQRWNVHEAAKTVLSETEQAQKESAELFDRSVPDYSKIGFNTGSTFDISESIEEIERRERLKNLHETYVPRGI